MVNEKDILELNELIEKKQENFFPEYPNLEMGDFAVYNFLKDKKRVEWPVHAMNEFKNSILNLLDRSEHPLSFYVELFSIMEEYINTMMNLQKKCREKNYKI